MPLPFCKIVRIPPPSVDGPAEPLDGLLREYSCAIVPLFRPNSPVGRYLSDPDTFSLLDHLLAKRAVVILPDAKSEKEYPAYVTRMLDAVKGRQELALGEPLVIVIATDGIQSNAWSILDLPEEDPAPLRKVIRVVANALAKPDPLARLEQELRSTTSSPDRYSPNESASDAFESDEDTSEERILLVTSSTTSQPLSAREYRERVDLQKQPIPLFDATTGRLHWGTQAFLVDGGRYGTRWDVLAWMLTHPEQPLSDHTIERLLGTDKTESAIKRVSNLRRNLEQTAFAGWIRRANNRFVLTPSEAFHLIALARQLPKHLR